MFDDAMDADLIDVFNAHAENIQMLSAEQGSLQKALIELNQP